MTTVELANSFDFVLALVDDWTKSRSQAVLDEARKTLDEMHKLKESPDLSSSQLRVLDTMLRELSALVELCENWLPGDRE